MPSCVRSETPEQHSVTLFFNKKFADGKKRGHANYRKTCYLNAELDAAMRLLAGDVNPSFFYKPLREVASQDEPDNDV